MFDNSILSNEIQKKRFSHFDKDQIKLLRFLRIKKEKVTIN